MSECRISPSIPALMLGITLGLGIFGAGCYIGKSIYLSKSLSRNVTVKGITERDVKSDLGILEFDYREVGGALLDLNQKLQHDQTVVAEFLKQHGFTDAEIETQPVKLDDKLANTYQSNTPVVPEQRYILTSGIRIRSQRVDLIQQVNQLTGLLLQQGVPLAFDVNSVSPNPSYYFTKLDDIRPAMLAEATKSARLVAEQFAKDSDTRLDGIQHANQGLFQITSRDVEAGGDNGNSMSVINKKVRLVATIDYRLK